MRKQCTTVKSLFAERDFGPQTCFAVLPIPRSLQGRPKKTNGFMWFYVVLFGRLSSSFLQAIYRADVQQSQRPYIEQIATLRDLDRETAAGTEQDLGRQAAAERK